MQSKNFQIGTVPALLIGEESSKVFLYVPGLYGHKEEALTFASVAIPRGYQVLGVDVDLSKTPEEIVPLFLEVKAFVQSRWKQISLRANSVGCWFSMLVFAEESLRQALFVSPLLDMKKYIELLPERDEAYYSWVIAHPILKWDVPTFILRPETDLVVCEEVGIAFLEKHSCQVCTLPDMEHWFHTPFQLEKLRCWEESVVL